MILGNFVSFAEVGIFNIAMICFLSALSIPNAIRQSCQPQFSMDLGIDGIAERRVVFRTSRRMSRFGVVFGLPAGLIAGFYGLPIIYPNAGIIEENDLFGILTVLLIGWSSILLTSPDWGKVMGEKKPIGYPIAMIASVVVQISGALFFGSNYGLEQAAIFFSIGAFSSSVIFLYCTGNTEESPEVFVGIMEYFFGMAYCIFLVFSSYVLLTKLMICGIISISWHLSAEGIFRKNVQSG